MTQSHMDYLRALPADKITETDKALMAKYDAAIWALSALEDEIAGRVYELKYPWGLPQGYGRD